MSNNNNESFGRFDFVGKAWLFGGISVVITIASLIYLAFAGINYGIDFKGGTEVQVKFEETVEIGDLRSKLESLNVGAVDVQAFDNTSEFTIRFQGRDGKDDKETNEFLNADIAKVSSTLQQDFAQAKPELRRVDTVGPQVGAELKRSGLLSVFYCLLVILIYVGLRFDYKFAPGAVLCLFHDAVITVAIFVAVGKEMNVSVLAAIMTLIGLSLNDTIVVFDRMREIEGKYSNRGMGFIINKATNEMFVRTLITSGTTFVSSMCLYFFTDGTVQDIAFAISIGVLFGTYSSVYVAAPSVLLVEKFSAKKA